MGTLKVLNKTLCTIDPHNEGFTKEDSLISVNIAHQDWLSVDYEINYDETINGVRTASLPITISCPTVMHNATINLSLKNKGLDISTTNSLSKTEASLAISGDNRLDAGNNLVTAVILPVAVSAF